MYKSSIKAIITGGLVALFGLLSACGSESGGNEGKGGGGGSGSLLGAGGALGTDACTSASDCTGSQICHPVARTCTSPGSACEAHGDCGTGAYCDAASQSCLPATTGSPCTTDTSCSTGATCTGGACGCSGLAHEQETTSGPLDIYLVFDRTASMGEDCAYVPGQGPPAQSKACFATYAMADYLTQVTPIVDTRFAFQFMSQPDDCNGAPYTTPLVDLTSLPVATNHALVQAISDETFEGGLGTHIEGALRGISEFTQARVTPGREMIGVLMTDGDPNGCEEDVGTLRDIIAAHRAATGIRTFVIGMEGATNANLEQLGSAGGADPNSDWCGGGPTPCHYWNVGDGSGEAIATALQAIIRQSAPLPCEYGVVNLTPPPGEQLDFSKVNVTLTDPVGVTSTIGQVSDEGSCPAGELAWYYDNPITPSQIHLCAGTCDAVTQAAGGSRVNVVVGCQATVLIR